jgi:HipA-like protein
MRPVKTIGVDVFLEKRTTRQHVGILQKIGRKFVFTYSDSYFKARHAIPLGPEFPLTEKKVTSTTFFLSLEDRIPSRKNPAYEEYCAAVGVSPEEQNPLVLLSTLGRKGPSSFVFYPILSYEITAKDILSFRQELGLTTREFANIFEISQKSLNAIETGRSESHETFRRIEILMLFPALALHFLTLNRGWLVHEKWEKAISALQKK